LVRAKRRALFRVRNALRQAGVRNVNRHLAESGYPVTRPWACQYKHENMGIEVDTTNTTVEWWFDGGYVTVRWSTLRKTSPMIYPNRTYLTMKIYGYFFVKWRLAHGDRKISWEKVITDNNYMGYRWAVAAKPLLVDD
jgi:hypothetical protein